MCDTVIQCKACHLYNFWTWKLTCAAVAGLLGRHSCTLFSMTSEKCWACSASRVTNAQHDKWQIHLGNIAGMPVYGCICSSWVLVVHWQHPQHGANSAKRKNKKKWKPPELISLHHFIIEHALCNPQPVIHFTDSLHLLQQLVCLENRFGGDAESCCINFRYMPLEGQRVFCFTLWWLARITCTSCTVRDHIWMSLNHALLLY